MKPLTAGRAVSLADLVAGVSIAGLLLPQAVAYSGIAGLPPQTGVIALPARVKDTVRDLLHQVRSPDLPDAVCESWSVDDAVQAAATPVTH